jgi:DNA helicase HerA-like ATPase
MSNGNVIGRVLLTQREPAGPFSFWVWTGSGAEGLVARDVEVGSLIVAESRSGSERIIGVVEDIQNRTAIEDHVSAFYGSGYGNPNVDPPVSYPTVSVLKVRVLYRTPSRVTPPDSAWRVRYADDSDVDLIALQTPEDLRVPLGLLQIRPDPTREESWIPFFGNAEYLFGMQAAHMNISGMTGLATKTSYALFVVLASMAWANRNNVPFTAVLFNVKHDDFLGLDQLPGSWEEAEEQLTRWEERIGGGIVVGQSRAMWARLRQWVDPLTMSANIRYFTYRTDPSRHRLVNPVIYSYGLSDVGAPAVLSGVFGDMEEEGSPQLALLERYMSRIERREIQRSFQQLINALENPTPVGGREVTIADLGASRWRQDSVTPLLRKVNRFLDRAEAVITVDRPQGRPIAFGQLLHGGINIVQLHGLNDEAQRLVFNAVIKDIADGLQQARNQRERTRAQSPDANLGLEERVVVVVDELNKFAPRTGSSPVKEGIRDVVQRGRDLHLVLFGAEQYASQIDPGVYGNPGTEVIGRSRDAELSEVIYRYLGDLKKQIPLLPKGKMVVNHAIYPNPVIVSFPPLLHQVTRELARRE